MAYTGNSIVDFLKSVGQDSSFASRAKLAQQYGIPNYSGTAEQNLKLLGTLKNNQASTPPANTTPANAPVQAQTQLNPLQQVNQVIQDTFQKLQNEVIKKFGEYRAGKPFRVDEVLAEKGAAAKEQIDPYYNEKLGDYLTGVTNKINRSTDDTKDLLTELSTGVENYTGRAKVALDESVNKAEEGFAESGLFGSGEQLATEGQLKYDTGNAIDDYTRKSDIQTKQLKTGLDRTLTDINLGKNDYVRNLERNRFTDIQNRAGQLTKEAGQQYIQGFKAVLPPEMQASSGFDLLKDLGIYS